MTLNEYQQEALQFQLPSATQLSYLINGLAAEAGEVCGHYAKQIRDDVDKTDLIVKEIGDVMWFCAALANHYDLNLSDVAQGNISKLRSRQLRGVLQGVGDDR